MICDGCGEQAVPDEYEFHEFISVSHQCGYGSIHGDGNQLSIDLCQQCFGDMCGDSLSIIDTSKEAGDSDLQIAARDVLSINKITNQSELTVALKRVEQLWDAQYHSVQGNELHQLADLICKYEGGSWDSYANEVSAASDGFMAERENIIKEKGSASDILSGIKVNSSVSDDESLQGSIDEGVCISLVLPEAKFELLEAIANVWTQHPDLRLTQLIVNAVHPMSYCSEVFYVEDNQLLIKLKKLLGNST